MDPNQNNDQTMGGSTPPVSGDTTATPVADTSGAMSQTPPAAPTAPVDEPEQVNPPTGQEQPTMGAGEPSEGTDGGAGTPPPTVPPTV